MSLATATGEEINMKIKKIVRKNGFTLIELLVVATIIIVLSAIGLVSFTNAGRGARNSKRKSDLETVRQALVLYKSDTGRYPVQTVNNNASYNTMISALSAGSYVSTPTPADPKTGSTGCGITGATTCNYTYVGTANTFTLSAPLEREATYTVSNP